MSQSEASFTKQVIQLAMIYGWEVLHIRPARTARGWVTPIQGSGKGFPDLLMLRKGRQVVAELKRDTGRLTVEQDRWLAAFRLVPGVECFLWRPCDWEQIVEVLGP